MGEECSAHGDDELSVQNLVGKSEEKKPVSRPRSKWKDIKMDLREHDGWVCI